MPLTERKKILVLLEYVRVDHVKQKRDNTVELNFLNSPMGRKLKDKLNSIGVNSRDIDIEYMYNQVPEPKQVNYRTGKPVSYKDPTLKEVKPRFDYLDSLITNEQYDMVIPTGKLGCKYLLDKVSITKLRGVPVEKELEGSNGKHTFWVFPMYSMEYISAKPNNEVMYDADLSTLKKYIDKGDEAFTPSKVTYEFVDNMDRVREIFTYLKTEKPVSAWDLETNTLKSDNLGAKALVISISWKETQGVTIPLEHKDFVWKPEELKEILDLIKEYVADTSQVKVLQNGGYDIHFLMSAYDIQEFSNNRDTKIAYYLTVSQEASKSFRLSDLAYEMTDMGGYDAPLEEWKKEYIKKYKKEHNQTPVNEVDGSNFNYEWIPLKEFLSPYASGDVDCTLRIYNVLWEKVKTYDKWVTLFTDFYPRLMVTLARMESTGFAVNEDYLDELDVEYNKELERLTNELRDNSLVQEVVNIKNTLYETGLKEWAKPKDERDPEIAKLRTKYKNKLEFNPTSAEDKGRLFFQVLGAKPPKGKETVKDKSMNIPEDELTWSDYKTDKNNIEWIAENHPEYNDLMDMFLQYSKVTTLNSTFVKGIRKSMSNKDKNAHGHYNITGTDTSRLSSSQINFQNIPSSHQHVTKFDYKYPIKRAFVSRFNGGALMQADYSALEMRILGLRAMDEGMTEAFIADKDLHKNTASIVFGKPEEEVTKDERQASKAVSFGLAYGKSVASQAVELGISEAEAQDIFDKFFATKPNIKEFIENTHKFVEDNGYVETMQGHRRILRDVWGDRSAKSSAMRQSVNTIK